jgi:orotate phosphoribosyltransferase
MTGLFGGTMKPLRIQSNDTTRARAFQIIKDKSFTFGDFTLASGKRSRFYLDMKPTMFDPEGASLLAQMIFARLATANVDFVGGLEMGAVPLIAPINMLSYEMNRPIPGFFVRKEVKDHGTKKSVEIKEGSLRDKGVAILEDVTTSGNSAMTAVKAVQAIGGTVNLVLTIVDREEGAAELFEQAGIPFDRLFAASEFLATL